MILYDNIHFSSPTFRWTGTVWPKIRTKCVLAALYLLATFLFYAVYEVECGSEGRTLLFGTIIFLLIVRANQAHARYWEGRTVVTQLFSDIRELVLLNTTFLRGGMVDAVSLWRPDLDAEAWQHTEDAHDRQAREIRVDIVRLCVALAVAFRLHTDIAFDGYLVGSVSRESRWSIDWDRFRLKQLLYDEEFQLVDRAVGFKENTSPRQALKQLVAQFRGRLGQPGPKEPPADWPASFEVDGDRGIRPWHVVIFLLREVLVVSRFDLVLQPWGLKERFAVDFTTILGQIDLDIHRVDQIISTPVPMPYVNLCKTLLLIYLLTLPFFVDYQLGWFANTVIPSAVTVGLLGVDAIATELENPFGNGANGLDILELISVLECEAMELFNLSGNVEARRRFCWRRLPDFVRERSLRPLHRQLAFVDVAVPEVTFPDGAEHARNVYEQDFADDSDVQAVGSSQDLLS